jgi:spore germination cell wall hydrolase CwlJ-like protein
MTELTPTAPRRGPLLAVGLLVLMSIGLVYVAGAVDWARVQSWWTPSAAAERPVGPARPKATAALPAVQPQIFKALTPQEAALLNAALPVSGLPNPAAAPFALPEVSPTDRVRAVTCLAMAVYYEAGNQGPDGEAAVAQVVLNRVRHPVFPKTVCGVVFQGSERPTGCQFTFTCDGSLHRRPSDAGWKDAVYVAQRALNGYVEKAVGDATHYHTIWVVPYWQPTVLKVAQIGAHVFYRWPGAFGEPLAFHERYAAAEMEPPLPAGLTLASVGPDGPSVAPPEAPVLATQPHTSAAVMGAEQQAQIAAPAKLTTLGAVPELRQPSDGYFGQAPTAIQRLPM